MAKSISPEDLQELLDQNQEITLIDVRRKTDYDTSPQKIRKAHWRDPEKIAEWMNTVPKNRDAVVYCVKGGSVSQSVADQLKNKNYNVKFLEGGMKAWKEMDGLTE
jgi:rhodanese-related sulfurtransferase